MKKILLIGSVFLFVVLGVGIFVSTSAHALATTVYVDGSAPSSGNGTQALPFQTIQQGVAAASSGDTVNVASGIYTEAVSISKSITVVGAGVASTIIKTPSSLPAEGSIINASGTSVNVDISGMTIEGPGPSGCGSLMSGIFVSSGAYASIHDMTLTNIADGPLSGCQNGRAVLVGWGHGGTIPNTTGSATVNNLTISGYQKAGIEVSGAGSSATITNNTITGIGATSTIAQNGIEVTFGASGDVSGNTVTGNSYTGSDFAAGLLLYEPAATTMVGANSVSGNQFGLWTDDQTSFPAVSISGISGNVRNAVADTTGWSVPTSSVVNASFAGASDSNGRDIVFGGVWGYNAFTTIQPAINVLTNGGTVSVAAGTYSGNLIIPTSSIALQGTGSPVLNLGAGYGINLDNPPMTPTRFTMSGFTVNAMPSTTYAFKAYKADGLTLTNDTFNGGVGNTGGGVDINTTKNVTFNNVIATGFHKNGFADTVAYAASDTPASGITFNDVTSTNNGWTGISFYTIGNAGGAASINGVHFTGTSTISGNGEGIFIEGDTDANFAASSTPRFTITSDGTTLDLTRVAFGSNNTSYDVVNYQTAPVNAVGATFGGLTGNAMTLTQRTTENGKIYDKLDLPALGLVSYYVPDTTRPTLVYNSPAANAVVSSSLPVSVTATDAGSGLAVLVVHVYNASGTLLGSCGSGQTNLGGAASTTYTCTLNVSAYPEGNYSLRSGASDMFGNNQTVSQVFAVSHTVIPPAIPTLVLPLNGAITPTNVFTFRWTSSTANIPGPVTYEFHSSMSSTTTNGVLTTNVWDSGALTTSSLLSSGAPDGTWYWQVRAKDAADNMSAWSNIWAVTLNTAIAPALTSCPAGTTTSLVETDVVNANSATPVNGANALTSGQTYLLVASGTWQNGGRDTADAAYVTADNWTTYLTGDNLPPYTLGDGSLSLQVGGSFVNWGAYQPAHQYSYLYTGTGSPANFMVFDGDATVASATPNASWYGDNNGSLTVNVYSCESNAPTVYIMTDPATNVSSGDATLNGTNGADTATGHSFWVSTSTFSTASPNIPIGVYSTPDFGGVSASTTFSAQLSSLTTSAVVNGQNSGTMPITPSTTYYYAAWSDVNGTWYPGAVLSFTTAQAPYVTTNAASGVASMAATVNGTNGPVDASDTSFWLGTTSSTAFVSSTNPAAELPSGWYGVNSLTQPANGSFSYAYNNLTPNTTYYFVAWSEVGGVWYPGDVMTFATPAFGSDDTLSALGVSSGSLVPSFAPGTTTYTEVLAHNTASAPTVTATTTDPNATTSITQATSTTGTAIVKVTAQNGATKDYTVTFSLAPATTAVLNVTVLVDNSRGGNAISSNFTVHVIASSTNSTTFPGSAAGTSLIVDPNFPYYVNIFSPPSLWNYDAGTNGNCNASGIAGDTASCVITETYHEHMLYTAGSSGSHGQVLGASITGDEFLQQQIAALQAQLIALLQQYLAVLHSHSTH